MSKAFHEFRDPIHVFIRVTSDERKVVDSRPFQRLRYIHQLALSYLVYPGATHRRFEHSLGVMELASRVYDVVTDSRNLHPVVKDIVPTEDLKTAYWRAVIRMAALCHDIGHLPFSHAAEHELLPGGYNHERLTYDLIRSDEMRQLWKELKIDADDVAKLAIGAKGFAALKLPPLTTWETILSEIIVGDAFGVDRMDYLLRDSYHAGVAYGRFDHYRLIDCLRILPKQYEDTDEPALGVEKGGLQSAEALLLARYFMFTQVYFHPVRRIYDLHLIDFMKALFGEHGYPIELEKHLAITDNEVLAKMRAHAGDSKAPGYRFASLILKRGHFKRVFQPGPGDLQINPNAGALIFEALAKKFGPDNVRHDKPNKNTKVDTFPVLLDEGHEVASALAVSPTIGNLPPASNETLFVEPSLRDMAVEFIRENRDQIVVEAGESES